MAYWLKKKDYIAHHGIKGQRWGVRRYQNKDGSYTEAGKKRYTNSNSSTSSNSKKSSSTSSSAKKNSSASTKMVISKDRKEFTQAEQRKLTRYRNSGGSGKAMNKGFASAVQKYGAERDAAYEEAKKYRKKNPDSPFDYGEEYRKKYDELVRPLDKKMAAEYKKVTLDTMVDDLGVEDTAYARRWLAKNYGI